MDAIVNKGDKNQSKKVHMTEIAYNKVLKDALAQLPKGAFLTVKDKESVNTMTIGWGTSGVMWGRQVFVVGVRPSRHTYKFMELGNEFTLSIPLNQKLKRALNYCGTHSGKTVDKFESGLITAEKSLRCEVPFIKECDLHFECKIIAKHQLIPEFIEESIRNRHYPDGDFHMIFYGEILGAYKTS